MTSARGEVSSEREDKASTKIGTATAKQKVELWPSPSDPMKVARIIAKLQRVNDVSTVRHWRGDWLLWRGSHWARAEDAAIRKTLYSTLEGASYISANGNLKPWSPTRHKIANLNEALAAVTHLDEETQPPSWDPAWYGPSAHDLVSVSNGILSVRDRTLIEHDPHFFNLTSVPFDYLADEPDPVRWLEFLDQLWPGDSESITALQQWFGYVMSGRTDLHKIMLLIGPTRAGKGVIARVLEALIGRGNVAGPTLSSLSTNFGLQPLIGKPLSVISDARLGSRSAVNVIVERLLSISGEDWLTVDRKYKEPWSGKLTTRFLVISNELPRFGDASGAIANRFVLLSLRNSWLGKENPQLTTELISELPGILNWALDGIDDLNNRGSFVEPSSSREAITALQDLTSPVSAFVRENCIIGMDYEVPTLDLWKAWGDWCELTGQPQGNTASFGRDLLAAYPMITKRRLRSDDGRVYVYQGVRLADSQRPVPRRTPESTDAVQGGRGDQAS